MPLINLSLQPTLEYPQPSFYSGKHLRSKDVLQCVSHEESRVAPPVGGYQVDVRCFPRKTRKYFLEQADVSYWPKISNLCWPHPLGRFGQHVKHHDRGTVP